MLEITEIYLTH